MKRALIVLAGCGRIGFAPTSTGDGSTPTSDAGPTEESGTRLKLMWEQFDDGARIPAGIFDVMRGERCQVIGILDGHSYCMPSNFVIAKYKDASCT